MEDNGCDLFDAASPVTARLQPLVESDSVLRGPRVGVSVAADRPWRLGLAGHPEVSAYRRSSRAPRPGESD
jgi:DNA-3-methyladenine glycosylase